MRNISSLSAPALVLCSVVSIQFGQALGKGLFDSVEPSGVVALRLGIAAVVLLLICRPSLRRAWTDRAVILGFGTAIAGMNLVYPAALPTHGCRDEPAAAGTDRPGPGVVQTVV